MLNNIKNGYQDNNGITKTTDISGSEKGSSFLTGQMFNQVLT